MALTWGEILTDRAKYPDDMKVSLGSGMEVTVGSLRNETIPKGDMTKLTTQASEEKKQLEGQVEALKGEISRVMAQIGQRPTKEQAEDNFADLREDKLFGPLVKTLEGMSSKLDALEEKSAKHEQVWWVNQHMQALNDIKKADAEVDVKGLIDFARTNSIANLSLAHRLMTRDRDIEKAKTDAAKEAVEKYKAEKPPFIPRGSRPATKGKAEELPRDFDHAAELAAQDPDVIKAMSGVPD